jgi:hypothetical protein
LNRNSIRNDHWRRQAAKREYTITFEWEFNKKRPHEEARQPGEDIASYSNRNSIRNDHRRRQDSQERILLHI